MIPTITYKQLHLINFPIFGLYSKEIEVKDGLVYINDKLIDDYNQIGDTLGKRRLQTPHKLGLLKKYYEDVSELISYKHPAYVDNLGYFFSYEKTLFVRIVYYKILEVLQKNTSSILKLNSIPFPVYVKRPPPVGKEWVGMIYYKNTPWLPYEYSEYDCATKRKKI